MFKRIVIILLILAVVGFGLWSFFRNTPIPDTLKEVLPTNAPTEPRENKPLVMPENVIQLGDSFEYYPNRCDGHLLLRITDAHIVTDEAHCPPRKWFDEEYEGFVITDENGNELTDENNRLQFYSYEEWFAEDGPIDRGGRILLLDVEANNVDAVSWLPDGTFSGSTGYYNATDAFDISVYITDLATQESVDGQHYESRAFYPAVTSIFGKYFPENLMDTPGYDPSAIQIPPGETITYTICFLLDYRAVPEDFSLVYGILDGAAEAKTSLFIDLGLEGPV